MQPTMQPTNRSTQQHVKCPICESKRPETSVHTTAELSGGNLDSVFQGIYKTLCSMHRAYVDHAVAKRTQL